MDSNEYFGDTCKTPIDLLRQALKGQFFITLFMGLQVTKCRGLCQKQHYDGRIKLLFDNALHACGADFAQG